MERFWSKVKRTDTCWNWIAAKQGNYGVFWFEGKNVGAHRFAYKLVKGEIPDGLVIDHLCNNPACVNPSHLKATTQKKNVFRNPNNRTTINANKSHCKRGHKFTKENTYFYRGERHCKSCKIQRQRSYRERLRNEKI